MLASMNTWGFAQHALLMTALVTLAHAAFYVLPYVTLLAPATAFLALTVYFVQAAFFPPMAAMPCMTTPVEKKETRESIGIYGSTIESTIAAVFLAACGHNVTLVQDTPPDGQVLLNQRSLCHLSSVGITQDDLIESCRAIRVGKQVYYRVVSKTFMTSPASHPMLSVSSSALHSYLMSHNYMKSVVCIKVADIERQSNCLVHQGTPLVLDRLLLTSDLDSGTVASLWSSNDVAMESYVSLYCMKRFIIPSSIAKAIVGSNYLTAFGADWRLLVSPSGDSYSATLVMPCSSMAAVDASKAMCDMFVFDQLRLFNSKRLSELIADAKTEPVTLKAIHTGLVNSTLLIGSPAVRCSVLPHYTMSFFLDEVAALTRSSMQQWLSSRCVERQSFVRILQSEMERHPTLTLLFCQTWTAWMRSYVGWYPILQQTAMSATLVPYTVMDKTQQAVSRWGWTQV